MYTRNTGMFKVLCVRIIYAVYTNVFIISVIFIYFFLWLIDSKSKDNDAMSQTFHSVLLYDGECYCAIIQYIGRPGNK